jgi:hypothetical protein
MRKFPVIMSALFLVLGSFVAAAADYDAKAVDDAIRLGKDGPYAIQDLLVTRTVTLPASSVPQTALAGMPVGASWLAVTNGQVLTLTPGQILYVNAVGSAQDATNTVTINTDFAASLLGKPILLVNHFYATNDIAIDIDGNLYGAENLVLRDGGSALFIPVATNALYLFGR